MNESGPSQCEDYQDFFFSEATLFLYFENIRFASIFSYSSSLILMNPKRSPICLLMRKQELRKVNAFTQGQRLIEGYRGFKLASRLP